MRRTALLAATAAPLLALAACAPQTKLSTPDVRLPPAFQAPARATSTAVSAAALDRWWMLFNDAQLSGLIEQALAASPDARAALARLEEARAVRAEAMAQFWPQGNLQGSASAADTKQTIGGGSGGFFSQPSGRSQNLSASFSPTWEVDLFGRNRIARRAIEADFATARFDYEATRLSLSAGVAQALFQARAQAVQLEDAQRNLQVARDLADLSTKREAHGLGTSADTARLISQARTLEAQAAQTEGGLRVARRQLMVLIGRGADPVETVPIQASLAAPPPVPATAPGELLARRPDVREADTRLRSASTRRDVDRLALFPTFTLQPGLSLSKTTGSFDITTRTIQLGLGAVVPLLDRPRLLAELRAQTARGEQAVAAYEKAVQSAYADAENGLNTLQADETRTGLLADAEAKARFAFDTANRGFHTGLIDLTTLIQAEQSWLSARASLTAAQSSALQNAVATFKALGGGWTPYPTTPSESRAR